MFKITSLLLGLLILGQGNHAEARQGQQVKITARSLEDYGTGRDSFEVEVGNEQRRLKIDWNINPRFFRADGMEIKNPRNENLLVRFDKQISVTYRDGKVVEIRIIR